MQAIKLIILFAATLASPPLWAQPAAPAGPPANLATNRPAYSTQIKHVGGLGLLPADFAYVTFGTSKFGFVLPAGFRLESGDGQKVTLVSADFSCLLTFRVLERIDRKSTRLNSSHLVISYAVFCLKT